MRTTTPPSSATWSRTPRSFTNTGIAVTNLRVAVTQRVQQDGQWRDGDTSFFKVNVWRGQAEHLAESLSKGDRVMVTGLSAPPAGPGAPAFRGRCGVGGLSDRGDTARVDRGLSDRRVVVAM
jgi:Single-strand binding protein family